VRVFIWVLNFKFYLYYFSSSIKSGPFSGLTCIPNACAAHLSLKKCITELKLLQSILELSQISYFSRPRFISYAVFYELDYFIIYHSWICGFIFKIISSVLTPPVFSPDLIISRIWSFSLRSLGVFVKALS